MSETIAPVTETPITPSNAAPGPVVGTTPPGADAEAAPVPAADFPESTPASEPAPTEPEAPASLLSEAKAETPSEETPPVEAQAPEQAPLPTYETFTLPEDVKLDEERLGAFNGVLGEFEQKLTTNPAEAHAAMQEMGQRLVDMYVAEVKDMQTRTAALQMDTWKRTRESWVSDFRSDPDIGGNRQDTTLARIGAVLELYGQRVGTNQEKAVRDAFALTGSGDHPEVLRFLNWISGFTVEKPRLVAATTPTPPAAGTRADRLYRNSIPQGAA